jgi:RNA polymerase sigma-70 factor (ECF subfamily)
MMLDPIRREAYTRESDEDLVVRVLDGDVRPFEILMRRHNQRLYRTARAIVRDDHEAEDVMQEAYVRAYEHLGDFRGLRRAASGDPITTDGPPARFSTWLTRITVNEALARLRKRKRSTALDGAFEVELDETMNAPEGTSPTPEWHATAIELRRLLENAVDELPDGFRAVFVMRAVEEMNVAETAECLGIPEDTVKTRLFRARALLRKALLERLDDATTDVFAFHAPRCDRVVSAVLARIVHRTEGDT